MPEPKIDPDTTWMRVKHLGPVIAITATAVIFYMRMDNAISTIQMTLAADGIAYREGLRDVKDEIRRMGSESVSVRQSAAWLELFQMTWNAWIADLRSKNPALQVGDFKTPALPR
jgi:hypothetical protein